MRWKLFEENYLISEDGKTIINLRWSRTIKQTFCSRGYAYARINGPTRLIHRVVCEAFHGAAPSPDHEVAHWDGDTRNNHATNLRWATSKENSADIIRHGRRSGPKGFSVNQVLEILDSTETLVVVAARMGVSKSTISNVRRGVSYRDVFAAWDARRAPKAA